MEDRPTRRRQRHTGQREHWKIVQRHQYPDPLGERRHERLSHPCVDDIQRPQGRARHACRVFAEPVVFKGEDDEIEKRSILREYTIFNVVQIKGFTVTEKPLPPEPERHAAVEAFIAASHAENPTWGRQGVLRPGARFHPSVPRRVLSSRSNHFTPWYCMNSVIMPRSGLCRVRDAPGGWQEGSRPVAVCINQEATFRAKSATFERSQEAAIECLLGRVPWQAAFVGLTVLGTSNASAGDRAVYRGVDLFLISLTGDFIRGKARAESLDNKVYFNSFVSCVR